MNKQRHIKLQGHLSEEQIKNYLQNRLNRTEKHQVEDHLLDCEFCSDAIEGFNEFPQAKVISREHLLPSDSKDSSSFPFVKVAAAVALVVSLVVGYWSVTQLATDSSTNISSNESQEDVAKESQMEEQGITAKLDDSHGDIESEEDLSTGHSAPDRSKVESTATKPSANASASDEQQPKERIIALNQQAEKPVQENKVSDFDIQAIEDEALSEPMVSAQAVKSPTPVYEPKVAEGQPVRLIQGDDLKEEIAIAEQNNMANSLSKYRKSKKQSNRQSMLSDSDRFFEFSIAPEGGWPAYEKYLLQNTNYSLATEVADEEKKVVIKITLASEDNEPTLEIVKGLCEQCNKEAIRLIKEGPKWNIINDSTHIGPNTAIVEVNFNLD